MRPVVLTKSLTVAVAGAVAASQALGAAGNLLINGTLASGGVATLDSQRRVAILSSGNDSALVWTVYGTNEAGGTISENVAGGNAVEVDTLQDFKTVTRVASSGAVAGTIQVGTSSTGSTAWYVPDNHITPFEVAADIEIISGAATATVEVTDDSPLAPMYIYTAGQTMTPPVPTPSGWPGLTGQNGNAYSVINRNVAGIRLTVTAGLGTVQATLRQSGIRN